MASGCPTSTAWCRPAWGFEGPAGEIALLLDPQADDITILKPRHSAFYASALDLPLTEMGAREIVLCGLATDMCVQLTAADAFLREFKVWVPATAPRPPGRLPWTPWARS